MTTSYTEYKYEQYGQRYGETPLFGEAELLRLLDDNCPDLAAAMRAGELGFYAADDQAGRRYWTELWTRRYKDRPDVIGAYFDAGWWIDAGGCWRTPDEPQTPTKDWRNVPHPDVDDDPVGFREWRTAFHADDPVGYRQWLLEDQS
jgi:hypothetical protein